MRGCLLMLWHQQTVWSVRDRCGRYYRQFQQRRQFRQSRDVSSKLRHADVLHYLQEARLVVKQQHQGVGWIKEPLQKSLANDRIIMHKDMA